MNKGPNQPSHRGGRRRRRKHGGGQGHPGQGQQHHTGHPGHPGGGGKRRGRRGPAPFVGPMDHSYRNAPGGEAGNGNLSPNVMGKFRPAPPLTPHFQHPELEPLPAMPEDAAPRIFAFVSDLFFQTKIQDTAKKLNVKVEFVKTHEELLERAGENGEKPSLIIFDLNNAAAKPLTTIPKLKAKFKKETSILGFVSHVEGELKIKAQEAGCDAVMPRSAFSSNLPQILRRHGASGETEESM